MATSPRADTIFTPVANLDANPPPPWLRVLWTWLLEHLIDRPEYIAKQVGIPELARLTAFPIPNP